MSGCRFLVLACALFAWQSGVLARDSLRDVLVRLPVLEGPVPTYYAAGTEDQARRLQQLIGGAAEYYAAKAGGSLAVEVGLLGPDEWRSVNPRLQPYSYFMTSVLPGSPFIISMPTGRGHALDILVRRLARESDAVAALGVSAEKLADSFTGLTALHEIGHFYARSAFEHPNGHPAAWLGEFVASYLAYAFLSERHPEDARIWQTVCAASVQHLGPHSRISGDFHVAQMADNYLVYLGLLQQRVNDVHRQHGEQFVEMLRTVWQQRDSATDTRRAMRLIEGASPGFEQWVSQHHR
jgi:hypothetical protein